MRSTRLAGAASLVVLFMPAVAWTCPKNTTPMNTAVDALHYFALMFVLLAICAACVTYAVRVLDWIVEAFSGIRVSGSKHWYKRFWLITITPMMALVLYDYFIFEMPEPMAIRFGLATIAGTALLQLSYITWSWQQVKARQEMS